MSTLPRSVNAWGVSGGDPTEIVHVDPHETRFHQGFCAHCQHRTLAACVNSSNAVLLAAGIGHNRLMVKKHPSAGTPAVAALIKDQIPHTLHPYEQDPGSDLSYGLEAAAAIGVPPEQVFKTLCVQVDGNLSVGIVPVHCQLSLKALAAALGGKKAVMAQPADAERATGYVVGGISPIGQRTSLPTVLDDSALEFAHVFVSGGRRGLDIGLDPTALVAVTRAVTAPIAKES